MATLTTDYQWINAVAVGTLYGATYYQGIYAKYSRTESQRQNRKSTIHIKILAYNTGATSTAWSVTGNWCGTFNGVLSNSWNLYATNYGTQTTQIYETSFEVTHDNNGNYSTTIGATSVYCTYLGGSYTIGSTAITLPQIILNPSVTVNGAGSSSSNYLTMSANKSMSLTLSNCDSKSTTIALKYADNTTYTLATRSSNGTFNVTMPIALWNKYTTAETAVIEITTTNSNGTSSTNCYVQLASSVIPTGTMTIAAVNSIAALGSNFVKGLTKVKVTMTGTSVYGASIVRAGSAISDTTITNVLMNGDRFEIQHDLIYSGTFNIAGKVGDARNRSSALITATRTAIDYYEPYLTWTLKRCNSSGTLDEEGTYALITATYDIAPINNGSSNLNTKALEYSLNNSTWTAITTSNWNGTVTKVVGGSFATNQKYTVYLRIKDRNKTNTYSAEISPSFTTVSFRSGGKGVSVGQVATADEFNVYMETHLRDGLYIGDTLVLYDDGN